MENPIGAQVEKLNVNRDIVSINGVVHVHHCQDRLEALAVEVANERHDHAFRAASTEGREQEQYAAW